jgi:hypothetical protein
MNLQTLPRTAVCTWLRAARVPVSAVARFNGNGSESPLLVAFDAFEATVKQVAGSILRDDDLVREGRTERAHVRDSRKPAPGNGNGAGGGGGGAAAGEKVTRKGRERAAKSDAPSGKTARKKDRVAKPTRAEGIREVVDVDAALDRPKTARKSN